MKRKHDSAPRAPHRRGVGDRDGGGDGKVPLDREPAGSPDSIWGSDSYLAQDLDTLDGQFEMEKLVGLYGSEVLIYTDAAVSAVRGDRVEYRLAQDEDSDRVFVELSLPVEGLDGSLGYLPPLITKTLVFLISEGAVRLEMVMKNESQVILTVFAYDSDYVVEHFREANLPLHNPPSPLRKAYEDRANQSMLLSDTSTSVVFNRVQSSSSLSEPDVLDKILDCLKSPGTAMEKIEPPVGISTELFDHQKRALRWMIEREHPEYRNGSDTLFWEPRRCTDGTIRYVNSLSGASLREPPPSPRAGILADEMGLGKTLTVISLIARNVKDHFYIEKQRALERKRKYLERTGMAPAIPTTTDVAHMSDIIPPYDDCLGPTLIVCPLSVISNWNHQIDIHARKDLLSVNVYHGSDRCDNAATLRGSNVVITTYSILGKEYSRKLTREREESDRRASNARAVHMRNLGDAERTALDVLAADRPLEASSSSSGRRVGSPLFEIAWLRVVLDEGHVIKSRSTLQARAAFAIEADRRWILSGTPIQNKLDDLFSLIHFLRILPFSNRDWWKKIIVKPMRVGDARGLKCLQALLGEICLRRVKGSIDHEGNPLVPLPEKSYTRTLLILPAPERKLYDFVARTGRTYFTKLQQRGDVMKNYAVVLQLVLHLRQLCCHPRLFEHTFRKSSSAFTTALQDTEEEMMRGVDHMHSHDDSAAAARKRPLVSQPLIALLQKLEANESLPCCLCEKVMSGSSLLLSNCAHVVCVECYARVTSSAQKIAQLSAERVNPTSETDVSSIDRAIAELQQHLKCGQCGSGPLRALPVEKVRYVISYHQRLELSMAEAGDPKKRKLESDVSIEEDDAATHGDVHHGDQSGLSERPGSPDETKKGGLADAVMMEEGKESAIIVNDGERDDEDLMSGGDDGGGGVDENAASNSQDAQSVSRDSTSSEGGDGADSGDSAGASSGGSSDGSSPDSRTHGHSGSPSSTKYGGGKSPPRERSDEDSGGSDGGDGAGGEEGKGKEAMDVPQPPKGATSSAEELRELLDSILAVGGTDERDGPPGEFVSCKMHALVEDLKGLPEGTKSVVFSQWTSFLDILETELQKQYHLVRLDGSMSREQRRSALDEFRLSSDVTIVLVSLKAGGLGLNLSSASYVFLMDPWWNPAAEEQAVDRVHRMGQEKNVTCVRYIIKDSIEERIWELQEKKRRMAEKAFEMNSFDLQRERMDDLKMLFS